MGWHLKALAHTPFSASYGTTNSWQAAYDRRNSLIKSIRNGKVLPSDHAELNRISDDLDKQLAGVLTKEEYFEYQLRFSDRAGNLRQNLEFFDANEKEFRSIYRIDQEYLKNTGPDASEAERKSAANIQDAALRADLGPERYGEYMRARDPDYSVLSQVAERYGMSSDSVVEAYEFRKDLIARYLQMFSEPNLTPEMRQRYSMAMEQEARQRLLPMMGDRAFRDYAGLENYIFRK